MTAAKPYRRSLDRVVELTKGGEALFLVGGTVRDLLLGRDLTDFDISGEIEPRKLGEDFAGATGGTMVPVGERFGTVRVVNDEGVFDFSALRGGDIHRDLFERDITINAMAYPFGRYCEAGFDAREVIDPLRGTEDLQRKVVRAVSGENLKSDPVRFFRVYRFASAFGFSVDDDTRKMAERHASCVRSVKGERARDEIFAAFRGDYFEKAFKYRELIGLISAFTGIDVAVEPAAERVLRLLRGVMEKTYEGVREIYFRELSGGRRGIDVLILLSLFSGERERPLPLLLFNLFRLSRREREVLSRVTQVMEGGLFPSRGASPIRPEAIVDAGAYLPHVILFADGAGVFGNRRNAIEKTVQCYLENRDLIERRELPFVSGKFIFPGLIKRVKNPKETLRKLMAEVLAGTIGSERDARAFIDSVCVEKENG
ncbi:MAG: hypothetical protein GTN70_00805 [Deltaproteobacteria bacterium]|nr:hypothetical protein [Deltaproteobacteria bacterium]NIS76194.1 hypothetical protein [Deltaproteobacteria bacterium]